MELSVGWNLFPRGHEVSHGMWKLGPNKCRCSQAGALETPNSFSQRARPEHEITGFPPILPSTTRERQKNQSIQFEGHHEKIQGYLRAIYTMLRRVRQPVVP